MKGTTCLVAAAIGLALLAGCTGEPEPGITPLVPTPSGSSATPSETPTPSPTPSSVALLGEAERTYRSYVAETVKLEELGGADTLPTGVTQYLEQPYLDAVASSYSNMKASGDKLTQTNMVRIEAVTRIDEREQQGAIVAISACVDSSRAVVVEANGATRPGIVVTRILYFKRDSNMRLRIFYSEAKEVPQC